MRLESSQKQLKRRRRNRRRGRRGKKEKTTLYTVHELGEREETNKEKRRNAEYLFCCLMIRTEGNANFLFTATIQSLIRVGPQAQWEDLKRWII